MRQDMMLQIGMQILSIVSGGPSAGEHNQLRPTMIDSEHVSRTLLDDIYMQQVNMLRISVLEVSTFSVQKAQALVRIF